MPPGTLAKALYHGNPLTGNAVLCRAPEECPKDSHAPTKEEAKALFDEVHGAYLREAAQEAPEVLRALQEGNSLGIPQEVLEVVAGYVVTAPEEVLGVVPSGSLLYNTALSPVPHDYDFVVFLGEGAGEKYRHLMVGLVDLFLVPASHLKTYTKQSQILEGWAGLREAALYRVPGLEAFLEEVHPQEGALFGEYFEYLKEHVAKHEARAYPQARLEHEFKHMLRWALYLEREPLAPESFSPRLTEEERSEWLKRHAQGPSL